MRTRPYAVNVHATSLRTLGSVVRDSLRRLPVVSTQLKICSMRPRECWLFRCSVVRTVTGVRGGRDPGAVAQDAHLLAVRPR
jgi:hypothetical protein